MFLETLAPKTKEALSTMHRASWLKDFYLAGGTALALQYGHRESVDFDWFTQKNIATKMLLKKLAALGAFTVTNEEENTLEGLLGNVKMSFMTYPYPQLEKFVPYNEQVKLAHPLDIAVMKVGAITGRNTKKDFIDLYVFLERNNMTLKKLLGHFAKKFPGTTYDLYHIYKSLIYFHEADAEPMPRMREKIPWAQVKQFFIREVRRIGPI